MSSNKPEQDQQFGHFLSYVSHEVRSPISSMLTLCEGLKAEVYEKLTPRQSQSITELQDYGFTLLNLLAEVSDLAKAMEGKLPLNPESTMIEELVQALQHLTHESILKKHQILNIQIDSNIQNFIVDSQRLKQIIVVFLEYAFIHSPPQSHLQLNINLEGEKICFSVLDQAPVLSEQEAAQLLSPAPQTSLGFPLAQQLAHWHHGEIIHEATEQGNCFKLSLPWQPAAEALKESPAQTLIEQYTNQDKLILLVEADPMQSHALSDFLASRGYRVKCIFNGAEAVQMSYSSLPHLIIMNAQLPGLDGYSASQQIKATDTTNSIPIVLYATQSAEEITLLIQQSGADHFLQVPFKFTELYSFL